jgi:hypothetical protein
MPKVSSLPSASEMTGNEVLPLVQGGATKKTTVGDLAKLVHDSGSKFSNVTLKEWAYASAFRIAGETVFNSDGVMVSANIEWPDGIPGEYTVTTINAEIPVLVDAWQATYAGATAKTAAQPEVTRDGNGRVTSQPDIIIT